MFCVISFAFTGSDDSFGPSTSRTEAKIDLLEKELSNIVGLSELKIQLRKWVKGMLLDERRRAFGINIGTPRPSHMAFLGNPGTGERKRTYIYGSLTVDLFCC